LGLRTVYTTRAEHQQERDVIEEIRRLAQSVPDPAIQVIAHHAQGWPLFLAGEIVAAREHYEQLIALYDPQQHRSSGLFEDGFEVRIRSIAPLPLWFLGYPAQALQRMNEAQALAQQLTHLPSVAHSLWYAAMLHSFRWEGPTTQEQAAVAIALAQEHGFPFDLAWATILHGWALAEQGQGEAGIA
jgi:adenylate cyclase